MRRRRRFLRHRERQRRTPRFARGLRQFVDGSGGGAGFTLIPINLHAAYFGAGDGGGPTFAALVLDGVGLCHGQVTGKISDGIDGMAPIMVTATVADNDGGAFTVTPETPARSAAHVRRRSPPFRLFAMKI